MSKPAAAHEERWAVLVQEWQRTSVPSGWDASFGELIDQWRAVEWRSGGKTLLAALGLQFHEVALCRGIAWLLDPAGGHGMGRTFVNAFLESVGVVVDENLSIAVGVEEARHDTRADIVVRLGRQSAMQTVVIEAKVFADEQPEQADRLASHWADETPTLVFLTRSGYAPHTARHSADAWLTLTWKDLAQLARDVCRRDGLSPSYGASELIETIGAL